MREKLVALLGSGIETHGVVYSIVHAERHLGVAALDTAARCIHKMLHGMVAAVFKDVVEADDIAFDVGVGVFDRIAYTGLSSEVDYNIEMVLLEKAVGEFSKLPGIGRKTALRLILFLLRQPLEQVDALTDALMRLRHEVKYCKVCHNISDDDICPICSDQRRNRALVCVVENIQDVMAIENTQQYDGI